MCNFCGSRCIDEIGGFYSILEGIECFFWKICKYSFIVEDCVVVFIEDIGFYW